jgi:ABC-type amino acid transport substrate-binding protein
MKRLLLLLSFALVAKVAFCQKTSLIIGANFKQIPDTLVDLKIDSLAINFVDVLDYNILKIINKELSEKYNIRYRKVPQVGREDALLTKDTSKQVDMLLFSFSDSDNRKKKGIEFSIPYFINNSGIGIFSCSKNHTPEDLPKGKRRIVLLENTNADAEMKGFIAKNPKIEVLRCRSYEELVFNLLSGKADMIVADVSRMSYFVLKHKEIIFVGLLPTQKSKIGDGFCVAFNPKKKYLKKEIDAILAAHDEEINGLEEKWLAGPIQKVRETQVSDADRQLISKWLLFGVPITSLIILALSGTYFLRKKLNNSIGEAEMNTLKEAIQRATPQFLESVSITYNTQAVWEKGIQSLNECEKSILYVGSGGFMSSKGEEGAKWREAIYGCLNRNVQFIRIVDLPEKELLFQKKKSADYIVRLYTWLVIQYLDLKRYEGTLKLYESRGAAFWGVGNIMLFKDEKSVLIFTSSDKGKMGTLLENASLVPPLRKDILETREFGEQLSHKDIMDRYFKGYPIMTQLVAKVFESLSTGEIISEEIMKLIEDRVRNHVNSLKEMEEDNSAPL